MGKRLGIMLLLLVIAIMPVSIDSIIANGSDVGEPHKNNPILDNELV